MTNVSVITTVYNEADSIHRLLESLLHQRQQPDEIVICDGGSSDNTVAIIESFRPKLPGLRLLIAPGANISRGRNLAIAAARGPIIAATDAGVRLPPDWLHALIQPLEDDPTWPAAAGFFVADGAGVFHAAMAATVLPLVNEIDPERFLPSSRSIAFRKSAWEQAGGYPEWLDYCEDLVFDIKINQQRNERPSGFAWAPAAVALFAPRDSMRSFWLQYYRYARGDGKADLWRKRHAVRYATYLLLAPALIGHGLWGRRARWLGWLGLALGGALYCRRPWQRLQDVSRPLSISGRLAAAALVPILRLVGDLAKMAGYPAGLLWRWRHRHSAPIHWRRSLCPEQEQTNDKGR